MLSRVAEALFWIGRYVERAEDTARLLDVHFHEVLEDPGIDETRACASLLTVMGVQDDIVQTHRDSRSVLELLAYDEQTAHSIVGALVAARQNARGAREALSSDVWQCLNTTHNALPARVADARDFGPAPFFSFVRECAATFAGYAEASMCRDANYDVLVLGRSLERVDMTARLLASRLGAERGIEGWVSTLRACSAHDAYLRTYQHGIDEESALQFLMTDRLFPRSVFHALCTGEAAIARLNPSPDRATTDELTRRELGRARTELEFVSTAALLADLADRLLQLQRTVSAVSEDTTRRLFAASPPHWTLTDVQ
jgi:uncharacterized alpha-E superfamily protein